MVKTLRKIGLRDLIQERVGIKGLATRHRGKTQIDGVFASSEIDCVGARFLPFWSGIGDHRTIGIDIPQQVIFGDQLLAIVRPRG